MGPTRDSDLLLDVVSTAKTSNHLNHNFVIPKTKSKPSATTTAAVECITSISISSPPNAFLYSQISANATMNQGAENEDIYNIIPVHNLLADHPSLRFPEVRAAAAAALRSKGDLRQPPFAPWKPHYDLLDWLTLFFGFQASSVKNQRDHLVLHLSNAQM